jgi:hypothetical protein
LISIGIAILAAVILAVILPVYFTVIKPKQQNNHVNSSSGSSGPGTENPAGEGPIGGGKDDPASPTGATSGGDGSTVIAEDGSTFTYENKFGGFCEFTYLFWRLGSITIRNPTRDGKFLLSLLVTPCNKCTASIVATI